MKVKNIFVVNIFTAFCLIAFCLVGWMFLNLAQSQSGKTSARRTVSELCCDYQGVGEGRVQVMIPFAGLIVLIMIIVLLILSRR